MFIRFTAAMAAGLLFGAVAQANQISNQLAIGCTGSLNITGTDGLSMYCEGGDLSILGMDEPGLLSSDIGISLSATGSLTLNRVTLQAPITHLLATQIEIGNEFGASGHLVANAEDRSAVVMNRRQANSFGERDSDVPRAGNLELNTALARVTERYGVNNGEFPEFGGEIVLTSPTGIQFTDASTFTGGQATLTATVPEPGSFALLGLGLLATAAITHRRRR